MLVLDGDLTSVGTFVMAQRAATESIRSLSQRLPLDLAVLIKTAGDQAYNANAALAWTGTGGVGPATCDGTVWKHAVGGGTY